MEATLSILGLHNATNGAVWDDLTVPDGIDQDVLIMSILVECAELEVLYPRPDTMKTAIGLWSVAERPIWGKLYETTILNYNPIWNKDGTVVEKESKSHIGVDNGVGDGSENLSRIGVDNGADESSESENRIGIDDGAGNETFRSEGSSSRNQSDSASKSGDSTQQVSAYDATTFQNREKVDTSESSSGESTEHVIADNENQTVRDNEQNAYNATDRRSDQSKKYDSYNADSRDYERTDDRDTYDADERTYERRETGNIGVTTTQQMIKEEREVDQFNIYDYIVQSFKRRFCLLVY